MDELPASKSTLTVGSRQGLDLNQVLLPLPVDLQAR